MLRNARKSPVRMLIIATALGPSCSPRETSDMATNVATKPDILNVRYTASRPRSEEIADLTRYFESNLHLINIKKEDFQVATSTCSCKLRGTHSKSVKVEYYHDPDFVDKDVLMISPTLAGSGGYVEWWESFRVAFLIDPRDSEFRIIGAGFHISSDAGKRQWLSLRLAEITISTRRGAASGSKTEIPAIRFEITPEREPRLTGEIAPTDIVNKPELPEFYKKNPYWK